MKNRKSFGKAGMPRAVVLTASRYNRRIGLAMMCPVISRVKGYPWEVPLPAGLPISGVVLADQAPKAAEDCRSPKHSRVCRSAGRGASFWTAPVLWRFRTPHHSGAASKSSLTRT